MGRREENELRFHVIGCHRNGMLTNSVSRAKTLAIAPVHPPRQITEPACQLNEEDSNSCSKFIAAYPVRVEHHTP